MALHKVTASFEIEVECDNPADIQSIIAEHQPYINAAGNTHGEYQVKSKQRTLKVVSVK